MSNKKWFHIVTFWICFFSLVFSQPHIPNQVVTIYVQSDQGQKIDIARVVFIPQYSGTIVEYSAQLISTGKYQVGLPVNMAVGGQFRVRVSAPDHQDYQGVYQLGQGAELTITLKYNNYYQIYQVDPLPMLEIFGEVKLKIDNSAASGAQDVNRKFLLPFPPEHLITDGRYPGWHPISNYPYRENLYHDLIKEIILQTAAQNSNLASESTQKWIRENYQKFGGKNLNQLTDLANEISQFSGPVFFSRFEALSGALQGAGILYSVQKAADEGLLQALLVSIAYQAAQTTSFNLFKERALQSDLIRDEAFRNAILRLESTLAQEQQQQLEDLVREMKSQYAYGALGKEVVKLLLSKAIVSTLGIAGAGAPLIVYIAGVTVFDLMNGLAQSQEMQSSMILLAQIDRFVLKDFLDSYGPELEKRLKTNADNFYGSLMRIHCGFLYHQLRGNYYSGKGQGFVQNILKDITSSPYKERIISESKAKRKKAELDYFRLSSLSPYQLKTAGKIPAGSGGQKMILGLIIDSSGSMKTNDPQNIRKTAAELIVNQLPKDIGVIIEDFDNTAKWLNPNSWKNWVPRNLQQAIRKIDSNGGTDIARSLKKMKNILKDKITKNTAGGIFLLTDGISTGKNRDYKTSLDWFAKNNIPIYTVSFVGNDNSALLKSIAGQTSGEYMKAFKAEDIVFTFNNFLNKLLGNSTICAYQNEIKPGENQTYTFFIDPNMSYFYLSCLWYGSRIGLDLKAPDGTLFSSKNKNGEWAFGDRYFSLKIKNPKAGKWIANFIGEDIPPGGENFSFDVTGNSPFKIDFVNTSLQNGPISFRLDQGSIAGELGQLTVEVYVKTPKGDKQNISDTFQSNKFEYLPTEGKGNYQFDIKLTGMGPENFPVQRYFSKTVLLGEYKPMNISNIIDIMGTYIRANLGSKVGNRVGVKCYIYSSGSLMKQPIAIGYVTLVRENECNIEVQQFFGSKPPSVGDLIKLDEKQWGNDSP